MAKGEEKSPGKFKKIFIAFQNMWSKAQEEKQDKKHQAFNKGVQTSRRRKKRIIAFSLLLLLLVSIVYNLAFAKRYKGIQSQVDANAQVVSKALTENGKGDLLTQNVASIYTKRFLETYINIPKEDEGRKQREKALSKFFVKNFELSRLENLDDFKGYRTLSDLEYLRTERISNQVAKVHYNVTYDIASIQQKEEVVKKKVKDGDKEKEVEEKVKKDEETKKSYTVEMAVPITTNGKVFSVVDNPSILNTDYIGSIDFKNQNQELSDKLSSSKEKKINSFVEQFLKAYASNDESLSLISNLKEGLSNQEFVKVGDFTIKKLGDKKYQVQVMSTFKDKGSNLENVYGFTLTLIESNDKYTVESIK